MNGPHYTLRLGTASGRRLEPRLLSTKIQCGQAKDALHHSIYCTTGLSVFEGWALFDLTPFVIHLSHLGNRRSKKDVVEQASKPAALNHRRFSLYKGASLTADGHTAERARHRKHSRPSDSACRAARDGRGKGTRPSIEQEGH